MAEAEHEVVRGLDLEVAGLPTGLGHGLGSGTQAGDVALQVLCRTAVVVRDVHDRLALDCLGDLDGGPGTVDAEDQRHRVGRLECVVAEDRPDLARLAARVHEDAAVEGAAERVEPEVEPGDDPEVPAGATDAPEQLGLLGLARPDDAAVGGDELDRGDAVERETEPSLQPADATAERQSGDAGVAHDADRAHEPVRLPRDVELAQQRAAVRVRHPSRRVHLDPAHRGQVDDEAIVHARVAGRTVPTRPDGDLQRTVAAEPDRGRDLGRARRTDDDRGPQVVDRVPQAPGVVVGRERPA